MRVKINLLVWYILKTVNPLFWEGVSTSWDRVGQSGLVGVNHATISEIGDFRTGSLWLDLLICYLSLCLAIENKANQNTGKSLILDGINCLLCHAATDPFRLQIFITSIVPIMRCAYWPLILVMQDFWVVYHICLYFWSNFWATSLQKATFDFFRKALILRPRAVSLLLENLRERTQRRTQNNIECASVTCEAGLLARLRHSIAARVSRSQSRSQSHSHVHLICVLPHGFSSKRETARSLANIMT